MVFEREGEIVFKILNTEVTERVAMDLTHLMQQEINSGTWTQHWPGDTSPGPSTQ